jgi:hypothetical protein
MTFEMTNKEYLFVVCLMLIAGAGLGYAITEMMTQYTLYPKICDYFDGKYLNMNDGNLWCILENDTVLKIIDKKSDSKCH